MVIDLLRLHGRVANRALGHALWKEVSVAIAILIAVRDFDWYTV
jgi:hypothetical protein